MLPTILARLGIDVPANVQGAAFGAEHPLVAELYKLPMMNRTEGQNPKDWRHLGDWRVLLDGDDKFGWSSNGTHFLVDLAKDPGERTNRLPDAAARARELEARLDSYLDALPRPGEIGVVEQPSAEALRSLRELGYTGDKDAEGDRAPSAPAEKHPQ